MKVCITTAGIGSRLEEKTKNLNKSLISVNYKPVLSNIIDRFPKNTNFVIALGYKKDPIKQFLKQAYPYLKFQFVNIRNYQGKGSGLGLTLLKCKKHLQEPFYYISCDTIITNKITKTRYNWVGISNKKFKKNYRGIKIKNNKVSNFIEKKDFDKKCKTYIGFAFINDYKIFWKGMNIKEQECIDTGEIFGLNYMLKNGSTIKYKNFNWFDTGNLEKLNEANKYLKNKEVNILEKNDEAIWFVNNKVIKYSESEEFIKKRIQRNKILQPFCPKIISSSKNMYLYKMVTGEVISKIINKNLFDKFLQFSVKFWKKKKLKKIDDNNFVKICHNFYKDKTIKRVNKFFNLYKMNDLNSNINGVKTPKLSEMLKKIDWDYISRGTPGRFHGDYHFENILFNKNKNKFVLLDWRQNFNELINYGDIYYDLAKILHGIIVSHEVVSNNEFKINWNKNSIKFKIQRKKALINCEKYFYKWIVKNNYDLKKVKLLTALIYLNIAPLHHHPYSLFLFALGKYMLWENLKNS